MSNDLYPDESMHMDAFEGPDVLEDPATPDDLEDHTDFDAFWRKQTKKKKPAPTVTICGQKITLPRSLPLQFQLEATRQEKLPKKKQDPFPLLMILIGERQVKKLARAGLDLDMFMILIAWLPARISGSDMTLEEVAAELEKKNAEKESGEG